MSIMPPPPPSNGPGSPQASEQGYPREHGQEHRVPAGRRLAILLATAALLGAAASTGSLAAAGAFNEGGAAARTTSVAQSSRGAVQASASAVADTTSSSLNAEAIYASAVAGVVEITATSSGSSSPSFFGQGRAESSATGSGFVVDGKGHIVTAAHVVNGATSVTVTFSDGSSRSARVLGRDEGTDVAVLKVDPSGLTLHPLKLGSSADLAIGDAVLAIGSPFGYQNSLSTGVVSGLDRTIEAPNGYTVAHAIQTDAALNPGNSGGPILNSRGRVIGIADQIATDGSADQNSGVGFAVPIDLIVNELDKLEAGQTIRHAYLGVALTESTTTSGVAVASVATGSPAANAGLHQGDVITAVDGQQISGSSDLIAAIATHQPGDHIQLGVQRGSDTRTVTVTLGTQPTTTRSFSSSR